MAPYHFRVRSLFFPALGALLLSCSTPSSSKIGNESEAPRLPTGVRLDPAGRSTNLGSLPLAIVPTPDGSHFVVLLNGYSRQGIQIVDRATGEVTQTITQPATFLGITFSPDGKRLYVSGGNDDVITVYDWLGATAKKTDTIALAKKKSGGSGTRYPAGIATSPDGKTLYVAENLGDSLAVVDIASGKVRQRLATEPYPYGVSVTPDGTVFVSAWGGSTVSMFHSQSGQLDNGRRISVGRHPSAMMLNRDGSRLFVAQSSIDRIAVIDTHSGDVIAQISDAPPAGPSEGATPNGFSLSPDGTRLYVAEADANAVGVVNLSAATSGIRTATGNDKLAWRIPVGWYPSALIATKDSLFVVNAKGKRTWPNPKGPGRGSWREKQGPMSSTLSQLAGTFISMSLPRDDASLAEYSARVTRANGWDKTRSTFAYPPIEHVIYIVKENRTYDQVLGDLSQADGDTALVYFGRPNSPNHHALAERFGIFDRFFVNAEVSADGHNWSMGAYASEYVEKTVESSYSSRGRDYDYEGTNRDKIPDDDVASPGSGYLWNLAQRAGITFRNYGEFVVPVDPSPAGSRGQTYKGVTPYLDEHTNPRFPGYDLDVKDQLRADVWIEELARYERDGRMPALEIVRLPNDHTAGARTGSPTPQAYFADNDLALGRIIEALSKTRFWASTVVFVLEDDAQNGSDHVDAHRSPMIVISPWAKGGVLHRFTNTTDVIATIEEFLKLGAMSQFDHYGRPIREIWASKPDLRPYVALKPAVSLDDRNPSTGALARESRKLALSKEDIADEDLFNRILWRTIKGEKRAYPGTTRMRGVEIMMGAR